MTKFDEYQDKQYKTNIVAINAEIRHDTKHNNNKSTLSPNKFPNHNITTNLNNTITKIPSIDTHYVFTEENTSIDILNTVNKKRHRISQLSLLNMTNLKIREKFKLSITGNASLFTNTNNYNNMNNSSDSNERTLNNIDNSSILNSYFIKHDKDNIKNSKSDIFNLKSNISVIKNKNLTYANGLAHKDISLFNSVYNFNNIYQHYPPTISNPGNATSNEINNNSIYNTVIKNKNYSIRR